MPSPTATDQATPHGHPRSAMYRGTFWFSCALFFGLLAAGFVFQVAQHKVPLDVWRQHLAGVDDALQQGDYQRAMEQLDIAVRIAPSDDQAWLRLGLAAQNAGEPDRAIAAFRRVLRMNPAHPGAHYALGALYVQQNALERALHHNQLAVSLQPQLAQAHENLALTLLKLGRRDEAIAYFQRSLALDPSSPGAREGLAALGMRQY